MHPTITFYLRYEFPYTDSPGEPSTTTTHAMETSERVATKLHFMFLGRKFRNVTHLSRKLWESSRTCPQCEMKHRQPAIQPPTV